MEGEIELYNISFLILKVELHFKVDSEDMIICFFFILILSLEYTRGLILFTL